MGDRKQPTPVPANAIKPAPPPAPPRKRTDDPRDAVIATLIAAIEAVEFIPDSWDNGDVECLWCHENSVDHRGTPSHAPDCQRQQALKVARSILASVRD